MTPVRCCVPSSQKALTKTLPGAGGMPEDGEPGQEQASEKGAPISTGASAVGLALRKAHHGFCWNPLGE